MNVIKYVNSKGYFVYPIENVDIQYLKFQHDNKVIFVDTNKSSYRQSIDIIIEYLKLEGVDSNRLWHEASKLLIPLDLLLDYEDMYKGSSREDLDNILPNILGVGIGLIKIRRSQSDYLGVNK